GRIVTVFGKPIYYRRASSGRSGTPLWRIGNANRSGSKSRPGTSPGVTTSCNTIMETNSMKNSIGLPLLGECQEVRTHDNQNQNYRGRHPAADQRVSPMERMVRGEDPPVTGQLQRDSRSVRSQGWDPCMDRGEDTEGQTIRVSGEIST